MVTAFPNRLTVACAACSMCYMSDDGKTAAERELVQYRHTVESRGSMVRRARVAGVSKNRIHVLSGIARTTIDRILKEEG